MVKAVDILGIERPALQHLRGSAYVVMRMVNEGRNGVQRINLGGGLLPGDVRQVFFEAGRRPVSAEVNVPEVPRYLGWCGHSVVLVFTLGKHNCQATHHKYVEDIQLVISTYSTLFKM